jgi:hypothetical protein
MIAALVACCAFEGPQWLLDTVTMLTYTVGLCVFNYVV